MLDAVPLSGTAMGPGCSTCGAAPRPYTATQHASGSRVAFSGVRRNLHFAQAVLTLTLALASAAGAAYRAGTLVCTFQDPRIREASGLAASSRADGVFFTQNDSGDEARFFAVDRSGRTRAAFRVPGARNVDWEDMARGPGEDGKPALYFGDIGDNDAKRTGVAVYRVPEPEVPTEAGASLESGPATRFELVYEDGPHDAESLLVHPRTGQLLVVTKTLGETGVYAAPLPLRVNAPNRLRRVARIGLSKLPTAARSLREQVTSLLATGAAVSPDGKRVVVRTYTDAYEWTVPGEDLGAAFQKAPVHIRLPRLRQGEAIAYTRDGAALLTTSEGERAPVYELARRSAR